MGCHFLLQGLFPTQGSNLGLLHCKQVLLPSEPPGYICKLYMYIQINNIEIEIKIYRAISTRFNQRTHIVFIRHIPLLWFHFCFVMV